LRLAHSSLADYPAPRIDTSHRTSHFTTSQTRTSHCTPPFNARGKVARRSVYHIWSLYRYCKENIDQTQLQWYLGQFLRAPAGSVFRLDPIKSRYPRRKSDSATTYVKRAYDYVSTTLFDTTTKRTRAYLILLNTKKIDNHAYIDTTTLITK